MRIGLVNDLPLALEALRRSVARVPGASVAWTAVDGEQAVSRCRSDRPDLVLMDLIMPIMDGVEATRRIMRESPCPILVVTATVTGNAGRVFEALGAGALDAIDTPNLASDAGVDALCRRIAAILRIARDDRGTIGLPATAIATPRRDAAGPVLLGASTGGPNALCVVLGALPRPMPFAVVAVQHLDAAFVSGLAEWLARETGHRVALAKHGGRPEAGSVWLAAGPEHLELTPEATFRTRRPVPSDLHHPSVDALFESAAASGLRPSAAALLTGMGSDGARGLLALRRAGWTTIAQDQATSVVWGMPGAAARMEAATRTLPLADIAPVLASIATAAGRSPP